LAPRDAYGGGPTSPPFPEVLRTGPIRPMSVGIVTSGGGDVHKAIVRV